MMCSMFVYAQSIPMEKNQLENKTKLILFFFCFQIQTAPSRITVEYFQSSANRKQGREENKTLNRRSSERRRRRRKQTNVVLSYTVVYSISNLSAT